MKRSSIAAILTVSLLTACGGGSGSGTMPTTSPTTTPLSTAKTVTMQYAGTTTLSAGRRSAGVHTMDLSGTSVTVTYNGQTVGTGTLDANGVATITFTQSVPPGETVEVTAGTVTVTVVLASQNAATAVMVQVSSSGTVTVTTTDGTSPTSLPSPDNPDDSTSTQDGHGNNESITLENGATLPSNLPITISQGCNAITIAPSTTSQTFSRLRFEENVKDGGGGDKYKYDGAFAGPMTFQLAAGAFRLHIQLFDGNGNSVLEIQGPLNAFTPPSTS